MALQKVFTQAYTEELRTHIDPSNYLGDEFTYDTSQVKTLMHVSHPESLAEYMVEHVDSDFECAVALYEAYKGISPVFAQEERLWVYLSHVDLYPYLKKRWPLPEDETKLPNYIRDHWFKAPYSVVRSALMGMWWSVYLSLDPDREDPYELTRILFSNYSLRVVYFGASRLFQYREAALGILQFFKENPEIMDFMEARVRAISRYFSLLGGVKHLYFMDRNYFLNECNHIKPGLLTIFTREQVENQDIYTLLKY